MSGPKDGIGRSLELPVSDGVLAGVDFGGRGTGVLLVHGSGHNALAWSEVAERLVAHCRPVAVDLRGHGQSPLDSSDPEQYWRDLGGVVRALGWDRPVLIGHSTGGYAVTAVTASGLVDPRAVCVVDGVVLDDRDTAVAAQAEWRGAEATERLRALFRYGWKGDEGEVRAFVEQCVREADTDWLNAGASPELTRAVMRRAFWHGPDGRWQRRPTLEEIATVGAADPGARVYPCVEVYEHIGCPMTIVLPDNGFYARRGDEVRAVVDAAPGRRLVEISGNHNVPMTRPADLAEIIIELIRDIDAA